MLDILFAWPDQLPLKSTPKSATSDLSQICHLLREQRFSECESKILHCLSVQPHSEDYRFLYVFLLLLTKRREIAESFLPLSNPEFFRNSPRYSFLFAQLCLLESNIPRLLHYQDIIWGHANQFWPIYLAQAACYLHTCNLDLAAHSLSRLPPPFDDCLESKRLQSRILERQGKYLESLALITSCVERFPNHLPLRVQQLDLAVKARSTDKTLPILNSIIDDFGFVPEILTLSSQIRLLQSRPADARHLILKNRIWNTIVPNQESVSSNLYNCYDRLGCVDWLLYSPHLSTNSFPNLPLMLRENYCMQLSSINFPNKQDYIDSVLSDYQNLNIAESISSFDCSTKDNSTSSKLNVGWICGDISYHPVGRFLYGILNGLNSPSHNHFVVDINHHGTETEDAWFKQLSTVQYIDAGNGSFSNRLGICRDLNLDIAIDLSGWTSGHFMRGFFSSLANIQISYLGYFATTGVPSINYWLGDSELFPNPVSEYHSEALLRLNRCFIGWNPPAPLPEATLDVADISYSSHSPVRFGCFNHHRKFSDQTLSTWGSLLNSIPGSKLVLKSLHKLDTSSSYLFTKRMSRAGISLDQIIWVPRANSVIDHLNQYSLMDIALDPFPNGGCTTTCEALWMGVPVVSLTGHSYVSRMSTAVLAGSNNKNLCASTILEYIAICKRLASNIHSLRSNRDFWRTSIQTSELGNTKDLATQLELLFSSL